MSGNATYRSTNTAVLSVCAVDAPVVVTSDEIDERLRSTYERVGLKPGMLSRLAGIHERRWWPEGVSFTEGAATAGAKALAEAGVDADRIGLMINTSVSRAHLEPSTAVQIHHALGLPTSCLNFDLANACLGFVNGMQIAGHDDRLRPDRLRPDGQRRGLPLHPGGHAGPARAAPRPPPQDVLAQFATLTLGLRAPRRWSSAAPTRTRRATGSSAASPAPAPSTTTCASATSTACAPTPGACSRPGWRCRWTRGRTPAAEFDWADMDRYIAHQISQVHTAALCEALGHRRREGAADLPDVRQHGPAAVPFTLAEEAESLQPGDRVLLLGIGSGLNTSCAEIVW